MANNRLLLVYRPTGKAVVLGSRLASGWVAKGNDLSERINALFNHVEEHGLCAPDDFQDDFVLAIECGDAKTQPMLLHDWKYKTFSDAEGILQLELTK